MCEQPGNDLIKLFKKLNIETGNINPSVIKAWFDTDSENLLKWMCESITEENYISPQENKEFLNLENVLTNEELEKEIKYIEGEYPGLFDYESNLFDIEIASDTIAVLEEQIEDYDNQISINQQLDNRLCKELSNLKTLEIKLHLEKEYTENTCLKLSKQLDEINSKCYDQILRYHSLLSNYEFASIPTFINNMETTELEGQFGDIVTCVNSAIRLDTDLLNTSVEMNLNSTLSELKKLIFQSDISCLTLQMQTEAFTNTLKFLDAYDINTLSSLEDCDSIQLNIAYNRSQQNYMMKVIEESSLKQSENMINQPALQYSKNQLNLFKSKLKYLNGALNDFFKILSHLGVMYTLYLQEKSDIDSSNQFLKNIMQYVQKDLQNSDFRREAMLKVIDEFKKFNTKPIESKFKLIGDFGRLVYKNKQQQSLTNIFEDTKLLKNEIEVLEKRHFGKIDKNFNIPENLLNNKVTLEKFLTCGPTCRIVMIPQNLQLTLDDINLNLNVQNASVKSVTQIVQNVKDVDKWAKYRRLLWTYFITEPAKLLSVLEELKNETKRN